MAKQVHTAHAHNINLRRRGDGIRVTITASDGTEVILDWSQSIVVQMVEGLCREAGLPEPWKKG